MRIVAGQFRGRALTPLGKGDQAAHLRPTTDRVRESLFNVLCSGRFGDPITGYRVLDLFAGTGALGLEALSRGASHVTFVDDGKTAQTLIRKNIQICQSSESTTVLKMDATQLAQNPDAAYDLIFMDPPYGKAMGEQALTQLETGNWIAEDAILVWEENKSMPAPKGYVHLDTRKYGDTYITILQA